jgi:hypothetical protein
MTAKQMWKPVFQAWHANQPACTLARVRDLLAEYPRHAGGWVVLGDKPFPLYRLDVRGGGNYPPGAPRTNAVVLVDSHEKPYHRLIPDRPFMVRPKAVRAPLYPNYHLLFLRRSEDKQQYITVGTYHSILPVSPVLDIRQLPPEPHTDRDDQPRVEISLEKAIRFIVKDYVKFKESQLAEVSRDLKEVLKDTKVKKR